MIASAGALLISGAVRADELKLKDGSKIVGAIVGYEENSFKVRTSYGYALVQRGQVLSISISDAGPKPDAEKKPEPAAEKPTAPAKPAKTETASASSAATSAVSSPATPASKASTPSVGAESGSGVAAPSAPPKSAKAETPNASVAAAPVAAASKLAPPAAATTSASAAAPTAGTPASTPATPNVPKTPQPAAATNTAKAAPPATTAPPAKVAPSAKPAAPPPVSEAVSGNLYTNDTYGFRMYKPPGWDVIEGARTILPGALTAMGTSDQRTYLLVGLAPAGETLTNDIDEAEQRLREVMASFRVTDQKRMMVSGVSSIAHRFRGSVDNHEWSGVVVFVPLGAHIYTIFGMTYADSDLVQIQENVINRTITSLQFLRN